MNKLPREQLYLAFNFYKNTKMKFIALLFIFSFSFTANAQFQQESIKIDDFKDWKTVSNEIISNNGKYVAYELNPAKGDGNLIIHFGNKTDTIARANKAMFSPGNDFVIFHIKQPDEKIRKAKLDKVKKDKMPVDSLGIWVFKNDTLSKFPKIKSYKLAKESGAFVAFLTEPAPIPKDTTQKDDKQKKIEQPGDDLVLFDVSESDTIQFKNVTEYFFAENGKALYFIQQKKDTANTFSSISRFDTDEKNRTELFSEKGWAKKIVADNSAKQFAFLFSTDTVKNKTFALYYGNGESESEIIVDEYSQGIPVGWSPSENGNLNFSEDASKLYFGTAESPRPEAKDTILDEEKPKLDIWNWQDLKLQPQQKIEAEREKKKTYLAVYYPELKRTIQLADINIETVTTLEKGNADIGLGYDEKPYLRSSSWTGERIRDYFLVDFKSGIKREILKEKSFARLSPKGKFLIWYNPADSGYYAKSTDIDQLENVPLTNMIPVAFYDEQNDRPMDPSPYGIAGWSEEDRFVFIYDRYDIWKIDPAGQRVPVCITKAFGRRNETRLRYVKTDPELEHIPVNENILLSAFDERTMSGGFFQAKPGTVKDPDLLIMDKFDYGRIVKKAQNADKIIWTKQNVNTYPDVWCSNTKFEHAKKLSNAGEQTKKYIWPRVELVEWTSFAGENLKGLLYTPDNLDKNKKYPMIVYFYERSAEGLHRFQYPYPSHSTINKSFYVSNGYLVFVPDITYKTGYPGESAYNAIVSGTQYLINKYNFVDEKHIGLQGQSWGGYQTAWLITQTDMYAAAMAGAPVSNMTSAYGGIRWSSGMSRMFQYEHTQSRIGGTLWEKPLLYIENSPIFHIPKINTPLLMMHNDEDGAVPWYQGIEMFVAMRRLDKPVWMLTYNGENHNLPSSSWANRVDLSTRMFQFFNHYLKGKPAPEWMKKGVPAVEKGENLGY